MKSTMKRWTGYLETMAEPVDWDALKQVFAARSPNAAEGRDDRNDTLDAAEERAAIMEYDGGLSRTDAEAYAFGDDVERARLTCLFWIDEA